MESYSYNNQNQCQYQPVHDLNPDPRLLFSHLCSSRQLLQSFESYHLHTHSCHTYSHRDLLPCNGIDVHISCRFFGPCYFPSLLYCSTIQLDIFLKNLLIFIMFFILYIIKELIRIGSSPFTTIFYTPYLVINFPIRYFIPYRKRRDMPQYSIIRLSCIIAVV